MTQWQTFLETQGATFGDDHVAHFNTTASHEDNIIVDLSHLGILQLQGDDAVTFLQGQVTNDVKKLDGSHAHYSGYCNPKGRLLAIFLAFANQGNLYLQFPRELLAGIQKRLKMYVLRSKVTIDDASDSLVHFGIAGPQAAALLEGAGLPLPDTAYATSLDDDGIVIRMPGETPRFQILTSEANAQALWTKLSTQAKHANKNHWDYLEILAGIPEVVTATQEEFVPQMVNLDAIGGISFKKGCYTGQEIVARTHYLGKVKRRTLLGYINASTSVPAGTDVLNENLEPIGKVVRSASAPNGGYATLSELRLEALHASPIALINQSVLTQQELPYQLPG
jgi:folate-binding protein YgfZ